MAPGPGVFMARASRRRRRRAGGASGRAVPLSGPGAPARGFQVIMMGGFNQCLRAGGAPFGLRLGASASASGLAEGLKSPCHWQAAQAG
jgi:hypothetical protein